MDMSLDPIDWRPPLLVKIDSSSDDDLRGCRSDSKSIAAKYARLIKDTRTYCAMMPEARAKGAIAERNRIMEPDLSKLEEKYNLVLARREQSRGVK